MGKTQLALEYAHKHLNDYPGGVFWIRAEDEQQLQDSFDSLGAEFGVPQGIEERPKRVLERMRKSPIRCLIVFDNITSSTPQGWMPNSGSIDLLGTTREIDAVRALYSRVTLPDLDEREGMALLLANRKHASNAERVAARRIVVKTGGLPLAIALLAYYSDRLSLILHEEEVHSFAVRSSARYIEQRT